jgi:hypothetical protein
MCCIHLITFVYSRHLVRVFPCSKVRYQNVSNTFIIRISFWEADLACQQCLARRNGE